MKKLEHYRKAVIAAFGFVAIGVAVLADSDFTSRDGIIKCVIALLTAYGVYRVPNKPQRTGRIVHGDAEE